MLYISLERSFYSASACFLCIKINLYKMVDNKSKTSTVRHIRKDYITHEDQQYNTHGTQSYIIVIFIQEILFSVNDLWEVFLF